MFIKYLLLFHFFCLLFFLNPLCAVKKALDEDLENYRNKPLISGITNVTHITDIKEGRRAAITVCSTPLSSFGISYNHVFLVFEIKHLESNHINLFSVHFGGEGSSSNSAPTKEDHVTTLIRVNGGKEISDFGYAAKDIKPIYSKEVSFLVDYNAAITALRKVESDCCLKYQLIGCSPLRLVTKETKAYNCCTYANEVLKEAGIMTGFDNNWLKTPSAFIDRCNNCLHSNRIFYKKNGIRIFSDQSKERVEPLQEKIENSSTSKIQPRPQEQPKALNNVVLPTSPQSIVPPHLTREDLKNLCANGSLRKENILLEPVDETARKNIEVALRYMEYPEPLALEPDPKTSALRYKVNPDSNGKIEQIWLRGAHILDPKAVQF